MKKNQSIYDVHARVITPHGAGSVLSRRMAPPDYTQAQAYSVLLDSARDAAILPPFPRAAGTMVPAESVTLELAAAPGEPFVDSYNGER
jgi:hypothetical protein